MKLGRVLYGAAAAALTIPIMLTGSTASAAPAGPASSLPCSNHQLSNCPKPGEYSPGPGSVSLYSDSADGLHLFWDFVHVWAPPNVQEPVWMTAYIDYANESASESMTFTCSSVTDPTLAKEWFFRDGKKIGYVSASSTTCSIDPGLTFTIGPGQNRLLCASFNNVPWKGDAISLQWLNPEPDVTSQPSVSSYYVNPYNGYLGPTGPLGQPCGPR